MMRSIRRRMKVLVGVAALAAGASGAASARAALLFQNVPNAFSNACGGNGCYVNYLRLTDIDGDGDLDVLFPAATGQAEAFAVFVNDGTGNFTDNSAAAVGGFKGHLRQIAVGDVDGDGDVDIYAPDAQGGPDKLFINDSKGIFTDEAAARLPAGLGSHAAATRFADVDNDGDLDLFVGDRYAGGSMLAAHLYLNDGAGKFTDSTINLPMSSAGDVPYDFDVFDADRDFDLDLLIDMHSGGSMLWLNDGTGKYTAAMFPSQAGLKYGPVACDVDGDGDLDLWFDNAGPGYTEELLINDGAGVFVDETAARVTGNPGADDNGLSCIDYDGDGDLDAAIASLGNQERILTNDGTGHFALDPGTFSVINDSTLWFDFGDVNGDGRLDCVTGQGESGTFTQRLYLGTALAPVDVKAPKIIKVSAVPATVAPGEAPIVRFAVSDNATTDEGPRLKEAVIKVTVGVSMAVSVKATFMGGDLYRAVLPAQAAPGTMVSYVACATDRVGNEGCSPPQTYAVEGMSASTGAGAGGAGGAGSSSVTAGGTGAGGGTGSGVTASATAAATSGVGGAGPSTTSGAGGDSVSPGDDSGCGCSVAGGSGPTALGGLAAAVIAALLGRRRRGRISPSRV
jgi:MYXO-CTERM domain-containing protein